MEKFFKQIMQNGKDSSGAGGGAPIPTPFSTLLLPAVAGASWWAVCTGAALWFSGPQGQVYALSCLVPPLSAMRLSARFRIPRQSENNRPWVSWRGPWLLVSEAFLAILCGEVPYTWWLVGFLLSLLPGKGPAMRRVSGAAWAASLSLFCWAATDSPMSDAYLVLVACASGAGALVVGSWAETPDKG